MCNAPSQSGNNEGNRSAPSGSPMLPVRRDSIFHIWGSGAPPFFFPQLPPSVGRPSRPGPSWFGGGGPVSRLTKGSAIPVPARPNAPLSLHGSYPIKPVRKGGAGWKERHGHPWRSGLSSLPGARGNLVYYYSRNRGAGRRRLVRSRSSPINGRAILDLAAGTRAPGQANVISAHTQSGRRSVRVPG